MQIWEGGEDLKKAAKKAKEVELLRYIEDLRNEFIKDFVFPMIQSSAIYEGSYLLGTSIARPLIAKRQIEIAKEKAYAVSWFYCKGNIK